MNIISSLDNFTKKQVGENGNIEYGWSNNIREKILQFTFQLVRTNNESQILKLEVILESILSILSRQLEQPSNECKEYLSLMYRMIGYTRDLVDGKGEYNLTYMMIYIWHKYFPILAIESLKFIVIDNDGAHQYGSWKDIKKFCSYCKEQKNLPENHILILSACELLNNQIKNDKKNMDDGLNSISLAAKWAPREKSSNSWLFILLATQYYGSYLSTTKENTQSYKKALLKCFTNYRKLLSSLNRKLDTLEIKQCSNNWSKINFNNIPSVALSKQRDALLNKKNGKTRHPENEDRINCASNFVKHVELSVKENNNLKGKRIGMENFTKYALDIMNQEYPQDISVETTILNSQWNDNSTQNGLLGKMIAMVDVSGSMFGDPLHVAIAMGIRVAEKSILGKRVMTFSSSPEWVNLSDTDGFVSCVDILHKAPWGMTTNFYLALKMILDAIVENKLSPEEVQDLMLVVFSDMQIDMASSDDTNTLYEKITEMYAEAGMRTHGKPFKPPHLIFWNLRSTNGFPSLSNQANVSMMSGFNPSLLNLFCEQGLEALQSSTPWSQLERSLKNTRYDIMGDFVVNYLLNV